MTALGVDDDDFTELTDLASRALGAGVVYANDDLFAEKENLITPGPASHSSITFGHRGKVYDGWETRRRRVAGHDHAVVRLGSPGIIRGVVIDTAWFKGNYPPYASVEATSIDGYPSPEDLALAEWETVVEKAALKGDQENPFAVTSEHRFTHVRLSIYPDGGVARFRVHGNIVRDPRILPTTIDLAGMACGGRIVGCSDMFYSSAVNLIVPGPARSMSEGWENARRRHGGNDFVEFELGAPAVIRLAELDTSWFLGNAPGSVTLRGRDARIESRDGDAGWFELLPNTRLQPDTPHRIPLAPAAEVTHVRMDVFPDGGLSRVRLFADLDATQRARIARRFYNSLPPDHAELIARHSGLDDEAAQALVAARPLGEDVALPSALLL